MHNNKCIFFMNGTVHYKLKFLFFFFILKKLQQRKLPEFCTGILICSNLFLMCKWNKAFLSLRISFRFGAFRFFFLFCKIHSVCFWDKKSLNNSIEAIWKTIIFTDGHISDVKLLSRLINFCKKRKRKRRKEKKFRTLNNTSLKTDAY